VGEWRKRVGDGRRVGEKMAESGGGGGRRVWWAFAESIEILSPSSDQVVNIP
jgi:hypothetical protein